MFHLLEFGQIRASFNGMMFVNDKEHRVSKNVQ